MRDYLFKSLNESLDKRMNESVTLIADLEDYTPWSGAVDTWNTIVDADKKEELDNYLEELYPEGISIGGLNDLLWFDGDQVLRDLGLAEYPKDVEVEVTNIKFAEDVDPDDVDESTTVEITIEDEDDDVKELVRDALYDDFYILSPGDIIDFEYKIDESCKNKNSLKKLNEEISDEAYEVAEKMIKSFNGRKKITWDEFNDAFFKATADVFGEARFTGDDFETDVRGILSYNGYSTVFEGDNEGGVELSESIISSLKKGTISLKELENANLTYDIKDEFEDDGHQGVELEIADKYGDVKVSIVTWDDGYSEVYKGNNRLEEYDDLDDAVSYVVDKFYKVDESINESIKRYSIVVYSHDSGIDEKMDYDNLIDAKVGAKEYVEDDYYDTVAIVDRDTKKVKYLKGMYDFGINESTKLDDIDAKADDKKETAKKDFEKAEDDADADRDDEKKELNESVSKDKIVSFIKDAADYFKDNEEGCYYTAITKDLYLVVGYSSSDDEGPLMKIAYNSDDLQSDYDWDWYMPTYDDGEVAFVEISLNAENAERDADYMIKEAESMQKEIDEGNLKID